VTKVRFLRPDGSIDREVDAPAGSRLLEVAQAAGQPLEGSCEGAMACSTCHVIVAAEDFDRLPPASEDEDDMLDLAAGLGRTSRLACQIVLSEELDTLTVRMPGAVHDWNKR
jgi:ferredoxin